MRYRRVLFLVYFCLLLTFFGAIVSAGDRESVTFEVNILSPVVSIEVPERVSFGEISPGYSTNHVRMDINNTGTTAVRVTPRLVDSNEKIFQHLYFSKRTTQPFQKIGDFNLDLDRPSAIGNIEKDYFYVKLDLRNYTEIVRDNMKGHRATVIFWAVAQ